MIHYITTKLPNLWSGTSIRNYYIMKAALDAGKEIRIHYINSSPPSKKDIPEIFRNCLEYYSCDVPATTYKQDLLRLRIPYVEALKRNEMHSRNIVITSDIIQFQELDSYLAVESLVDNWTGTMILDMHNVDYVRLRSELAADSKLKAIMALPWLWRYGMAEKHALRSMDHILACSSVDATYFETYATPSNVHVVANGVDVDSYSGVRRKRSTRTSELVFIGSLDYPANALGVKYYLDTVHPEVIKQRPDTTLVIVGKHPPEWLETYKDQFEIVITGFVDDTRSYLGEGRIGICPIYEGSGTRLKILEYMACGMAVVSTTKGCEGLGVESGDQLFIAGKDDEFAAYIVELLENMDTGAAMGRRGYEYVKKRFDWKAITGELIELYNTI